MNNKLSSSDNVTNLRFSQDHAAIGKASNIPVCESTPVFSISPIVLSIPERIVDLQIRVSAPTTGENLPVILLSHGLGYSNYISSLKGYGPIVDFWASHGFVVIQPTHLDSKTLGIDLQAHDPNLIWKSRVEDITHILDQLDIIEETIPQIAGRLDRNKIAVVGHSMGGLTAGILLGEQLTMEDGTKVDMSDSRIKAGILLAPPGNGGDDLTPVAYENFLFYRNPIFSEMTKPALIVCGDADSVSPWTARGSDWHADPYKLSPGPKCLVTIAGGEHSLGGISGYDAKEAGDESVERAAVVERLTWAYLHSMFFPEDSAWSIACDSLKEMSEIGKVECK